jgi:hypothetical protein
MKQRVQNIVIWFILAVLLFAGIRTSSYMNRLPATSSNRIDVVDLYHNPEQYDLASPDGIASIIIREDLDKTSSINTVTAVVFDFRGYDTMGESFVLLTAISGAMVILRTSKYARRTKKQKEAADEKEIL